jgi:hypothetical protein
LPIGKAVAWYMVLASSSDVSGTISAGSPMPPVAFFSRKAFLTLRPYISNRLEDDAHIVGFVSPVVKEKIGETGSHYNGIVAEPAPRRKRMVKQERNSGANGLNTGAVQFETV